jgi:ATP-binding cassette subfamily F protein uup
VAELEGVSKWFTGPNGERKTVVKDFSATLLRGDKVGLMGPNGAGKTTLLKLILGELQADSGRVRQGAKIQVAYFDQMRQALDLDASLEDFISPGSEWIEIGSQRKHVKSYLQDFLFSPGRAPFAHPLAVWRRAQSLAVGRACLRARPTCCVLDEPTNDLDIDTLELLEELLQNYDGTVFIVSHDRTSLDEVVTSTLVFEGDGHWREYVGGVQDWLQQSRRALALQTQASASKCHALQPTPKNNPAANPPSASQPSKKTKLSFKEQRELDALPGLIDALEAEQKSLTLALGDGSLFIQTMPKPPKWVCASKPSRRN